MSFIYHEPSNYGFRDRDGHDGKFYGTNSPTTQHMIIECHERLTVWLTEQESEFSYYIICGEGYFDLGEGEDKVISGDLVVVPPGTRYTFGGKLKMLLINTPKWSDEQEAREPRN